MRKKLLYKDVFRTQKATFLIKIKAYLSVLTHKQPVKQPINIDK